jgi:outer membrane biogenesis lipoprotein LolB
VGLHRQVGRQTDFKFKITPHKQKFIATFFWQKDGPPDQWGHVLKYT